MPPLFLGRRPQPVLSLSPPFPRCFSSLLFLGGERESECSFLLLFLRREKKREKAKRKADKEEETVFLRFPLKTGATASRSTRDHTRTRPDAPSNLRRDPDETRESPFPRNGPSPRRPPSSPRGRSWAPPTLWGPGLARRPSSPGDPGRHLGAPMFPLPSPPSLCLRRKRPINSSSVNLSPLLPFQAAVHWRSEARSRHPPHRGETTNLIHRSAYLSAAGPGDPPKPPGCLSRSA